MTEAEMKLLLLRYNMLSKERSKIADMCAYTGEYSKWAECIDEMTKMEDDLREYGYEFVYADSKTTGEMQYNMYEIVPVNI